MLGVDADGNRVPIVLLSSRASEGRGLEGEPSYPTLCIRKPYSPRELVEQVNQILNPAPPLKEKPPVKRKLHVRVGLLELDVEQRAAMRRHGEGFNWTKLSLRQTQLLQCLMESPDRALTREQIVDGAWAGEVDVRSVDQCIRRLRPLLRQIGVADVLQTVWNVGYRLSSALPHNATTGGQDFHASDQSAMV